MPEFVEQTGELNTTTNVSTERRAKSTSAFAELAKRLPEKTKAFLQVARLKLSKADVLFSLPGSNVWMPVLRLAFSEVNSRVMYGRGDMPMVVGIETISSCSRECSYCTIGLPKFKESRNTTLMSDDLYVSIIDQLAKLPGRGKKGFNGVLHLNGIGEPTLDPKLVERAELAHGKLPDARIGFYSNGDFLSEEKYLSLVKAGVTEIIITPHSGRFSKHITDLANKYHQQGVIRLNPPLTLFSNRGGELDIPLEKLQRPDKRCVHPTYALEITSDGQVIICSNDSMGSMSMGNLSEKGLVDIWDTPDYKELRHILRHGRLDKLPTVCKACRKM